MAAEALDTKWLVSLLHKSFRDAQPVEVCDISTTLASAAGENFLSTVHRVSITMMLGSGRRKRFSVIVKNQVPGGRVDEVMGVLSIFPIECKVYTIILPMMDALMEEFGDKRDRMWCDCLGYQPYHTIVMEDLNFEGFTPIDRTQWQSVEQAQLVLRSLARFHAMSKILLSRGLLTQDDRGHNLFVSDSPTFRKIFPAALQVLSNTIKTKWGDEWREMGQRVAENVDQICNKMAAIFCSDQKFEVLNHGDLWSNNIMWKFTEYDNIPVSVRFIDWQFVHINSFVVDLVYFLYTSVVPSLRRKHFDLLLQTYQEALERNLKFFQWEGHIPTMEDIRSEVERTNILAFAFVTICLPVTSSALPDLSLDIGNLFDESPEKVFNENIFTEEKYVRETAPDLKWFCENGII